MASDSAFDGQMERIKRVTGKHTQTKLAGFLGIRQSSVSDAKRRGKIPAKWLVTLMQVKNVNPEWILTGNGPCFANERLNQADRYETGDAYAERIAEEQVLQRLSSRVLAEELLRRIVISQERSFCSEKD